MSYAAWLDARREARNAVFVAARLVAHHWRDQEGVNALYIDELEKTVAAFEALAAKRPVGLQLDELDRLFE